MNIRYQWLILGSLYCTYLSGIGVSSMAGSSGLPRSIATGGTIAIPAQKDSLTG
jgi:hypothetical protein